MVLYYNLIFTAFRKEVEKKVDVRPSLKTEAQKFRQTVTNPTIIPTLNTLGYSSFSPHPKTAFPFKGGENEALKRLNNYFFDTKNGPY